MCMWGERNLSTPAYHKMSFKSVTVCLLLLAPGTLKCFRLQICKNSETFSLFFLLFKHESTLLIQIGIQLEVQGLAFFLIFSVNVNKSLF